MGERRSLSLNLAAMVVASVVLVHGAAGPVQPELSAVVVGGPFAYDVRPGDSLASLAARYGIDPTVLAQQNGLSRDARLAAGQPLTIDNRHIVPAPIDPGAVLVNIPQRMLFFRAGDGAIEGYPVAVGRWSWPTPMGEFVIQTKERNPTWDVPPSILEESRRNGHVQAAHVPPGPANPLGAYWLGLSVSGIGIHGTNAPSSIFRAATHGCIRMHPDDIARLFDQITVGTPGRIIYEPALLAVVDGRVYLEVARDVYRRAHGEASREVRTRAEAAGIAGTIDWARADMVAEVRDGLAHDVTR